MIYEPPCQRRGAWGWLVVVILGGWWWWWWWSGTAVEPPLGAPPRRPLSPRPSPLSRGAFVALRSSYRLPEASRSLCCPWSPTLARSLRGVLAAQEPCHSSRTQFRPGHSSRPRSVSRLLLRSGQRSGPSVVLLSRSARSQLTERAGRPSGVRFCAGGSDVGTPLAAPVGRRSRTLTRDAKRAQMLSRQLRRPQASLD